MKKRLLICLLLVCTCVAQAIMGPPHRTIDLGGFNAYSAIFTGKPVAIAPCGKHYVVTFSVMHKYKGTDTSGLLKVHMAGAAKYVWNQRSQAFLYLVYAYGADSALFSYENPEDCTWSWDWFYEDTVSLNRLEARAAISGVQKFYNARGDLMAEGAFEHGLASGHWTYFHNHYVTSDGNYVKGRMEGTWLEYRYDWNDSAVVVLNNYLAGEQTPLQCVYYLYTGTLASSTGPGGDRGHWSVRQYFANGRQQYSVEQLPPYYDHFRGWQSGNADGPMQDFWDNGQPARVGNYYRGVPTGTWSEYYRDGRLVQTEQNLTPAEIDEAQAKERKDNEK